MRRYVGFRRAAADRFGIVLASATCTVKFVHSKTIASDPDATADICQPDHSFEGGLWPNQNSIG